MQNTAAIILAAGQGKRMNSTTPKVLHKILGRSLISFPLSLVERAGCKKVVVVVGHGIEKVQAEVSDLDKTKCVSFAVQSEQRGTGHAVMCALPNLAEHTGPILILSGDVPLLDDESLKALNCEFQKSKIMAMLTFVPADPSGYGRIIRRDGSLVAIREHRDCSPEELKIPEVNAGVYMIDSDFLRSAVVNLNSNNDQKELYLTDLAAAAALISKVGTVEAAPHLVAGVNDRAELWEMERLLIEKRNLSLMKSGVTMHNPETIRIGLEVTVAADTEIYSGVQLTGLTSIGKNCLIEQGCLLNNCTIEDDVVVKAYSVLDGVVLKKDTR